MIDKKTQKRLEHFLKVELKEKGGSLEQIATYFDYSLHTVLSWRDGKRVPKTPVLRLLEVKYGVKLLD